MVVVVFLNLVRLCIEIVVADDVVYLPL